MHYSSTTNAILLLTLNLCVYFIYFIAVNTLGGNFFLICRNWPDDLLSFARRGELSRDWRGVSPSIPPPPGVSALGKTVIEKLRGRREPSLNLPGSQRDHQVVL